MANEVQQFDMTALKQRVSDSVRAQIGMLIPDEEFAKMVEREVMAFFDLAAPWTITERQVPNQGNSWNHHVEKVELVANLTPFRVLVWEKCRESVRDKLNEYFNGDSLRTTVRQIWQSSSNGSGHNVMEATLGALLEKQLQDLAPKLVAELFRGLFASAAEQAKQDILRSLPVR